MKIRASHHSIHLSAFQIYKEGSDGIPQALSSLGNRSPFSLLKNPIKKTLLISSIRPLFTNLQFSSSFFSFLQFKR